MPPILIDMLKALKTTVSAGLAVKSAISSVLHPIAFLKDKLYGFILAQFISFIKKQASKELAEKIRSSATKSLNLELEKTLPAKLANKLDAETIQSVATALQEAGNVAIEPFGLQISTLSVIIDDTFFKITTSLSLKDSISKALAPSKEDTKHDIK